MKIQLQFVFSLLCLGGIHNDSLAHSLWLNSSRGERNLYATPIAGAVGDILTVNIEGTITAKIEGFNYMVDRQPNQNNDGTIANIIWDKATQAIGATKKIRAFNGNYKSNHSGSFNDGYTITGKMSVRVIDVLPNQTLVLAGCVKKVFGGGETRYEVLTGMVRREDVGSNNEVSSTKIAELNLEVLSEGTFTDAVQKGWLRKLTERFNPL